MKSFVISKSRARHIILHAAGLSKRNQFGKGIEAAYNVIDHLGFVQIDTNYVVERAHHHTIASRMAGYQQEWLGQLQSDGRIFEYFTSDAGYMPMHEFRFSLPAKKSFAAEYAPATSQSQINLMNRIINRISREGPLMVKDFENDRTVKSNGWWDWRPSKVALEQMYLEGKLITTRTGNFQKLYDLPENVIPADIDTTPPASAEYARFVILRTLQCLGVTSVKEIAWRARRVKNNEVKQELKKLVDEGVVSEVQVESVKGPLYMLSLYQRKVIKLSGDVFILSPFDPLNVFRGRLMDFFDFDYQIECFVPEPKRKYGYFSLPILAGELFIGRMDSKADRKKRELIVHNMHFEKVKLSKDIITKLTESLNKFALFNCCERIVIKKCNNKEYLKEIKKGLE